MVILISTDRGFGAPWSAVLWTVVGTMTMYASALVATRLAGRRTLSQLSAFDALTTIAIGTIIGSTAISHDLDVARSVAAIVTLFALQVTVGYVRQRSARFRRMVDFEPREVISDGDIDLRTGPLGAQLTADDLASQLRQRGIARRERVDRAVLEPMGGVSVPEPPVARAAAARASVDEATTRALVEAHLRCRSEGRLDDDVELYGEDAVVVSPVMSVRGRDGVRRIAAATGSHAGGPVRYELRVAGDVGLVTWHTGDAAGTRAITRGVDTFIVRDGAIVAQTTHAA